MGNQTKQARRDRQGRAVAASGSLPRIVANARKRAAQETAGRSREIGMERVAAAESRLAEAEEAVRDDDTIRISLPGTAVPAGRTVLTVRGLDGAWLPWRPAVEADESGEVLGTLDELVVRGPERVALTGPNGAGKTTLLRHVTGELDDLTVRLTGAVGYLPQRLDVLDESASVVENVRGSPPPRRSTRCGRDWRGSCSAGRGRISPPGRCPAASGSARCSRRCCSPSPRRSCCCSTSRRTTWTWRRRGSCPRRCPVIRGRCWWRATTCRSSGRSGSAAGCGCPGTGGCGRSTLR